MTFYDPIDYAESFEANRARIDGMSVEEKFEELARLAESKGPCPMLNRPCPCLPGSLAHAMCMRDAMARAEGAL